MSLEQARKVLIEERMCKKCKTEERSVLNMPCGHLASCVACSKIVTKCSICQEEIKEKIRTYRM